MQLDFDSSQVTYEELVEMFFTFHDAAQAPETGWARSVIFVDGSEQEQIARAVMQRVQAESSVDLESVVADMMGEIEAVMAPEREHWLSSPG